MSEQQKQLAIEAAKIHFDYNCTVKEAIEKAKEVLNV